MVYFISDTSFPPRIACPGLQFKLILGAIQGHLFNWYNYHHFNCKLYDTQMGRVTVVQLVWLSHFKSIFGIS